MRKILTLLFMVAAWLSFAQTGNVGVNTTTPDAVLEVYSTTKGVLVPRLTTAQRDAMVSPLNSANTVQEGTIIYNLDQHCLQYNVAPTNTTPNWVGYGCGGVVVTPGSITNLNCAGATTIGTLTSGTLASGVSFSVPYTGGNGGSYAAQTVTSTGVTGLTANLAAGSFATGPGNLTYTITGTPASSGPASFALSIGGQPCTLNVTVAAAAGSIASLNCPGITNNGTLTSGIAATLASGVSFSVPYTGGNGGSYAAQTVTSTGVTGLTATLAAGNFASGPGNLTYTITGTPASSGPASFAINIDGKSCTLTRTVASPITIPGTITLGQDKMYMIASVFDEDYLPYTAPTGPATPTTPVNPGGGNELTTVNFQGSITTTGVTVKIPVTATDSGNLPAYSQTITIPANLTEEGTSSRDLTLSWASQSYTASTKTINATIAAVGNTLNAKKLDINAGIGNDMLGVLLGQFTFPYNSTGNTTNYSVRVIAGIPDRMFGQPDNGGVVRHNMLYLPIQAEDGNIWLNNNLGADYSNLNKTSFNLAQQATSATDYKAYGSLIQWGRKPDGHELITWTNGTTGSAVNSTTGTLNNTPTNTSFITNSSSPYDWRSQDDTLWATGASANNPCPVGFRVPTLTEQNTLVTAASITNSASAASSTLKFTAPGIRYASDGTLGNAGNYGGYWSSTVNGTAVSYRRFNSFTTSPLNDSRAHGFTVRCLKD